MGHMDRSHLARLSRQESALVVPRPEPLEAPCPPRARPSKGTLIRFRSMNPESDHGVLPAKADVICRQNSGRPSDSALFIDRFGTQGALVGENRRLGVGIGGKRG
jgi:hypothetical protein